MEWNLWTTALSLPSPGCHLPGRDCGGPGADVCNLGIQRVLSKITMHLWVTWRALSSLEKDRTAEEHRACTTPSKEMRTLHTLKSRAKRHENEGRRAAVSAPGLWSAELSWYQAKLWPLKMFSVKGALRRAKIPSLHGMRLSEPFPAGYGWKGAFYSPWKWPVIWKVKVTKSKAPCCWWLRSCLWRSPTPRRGPRLISKPRRGRKSQSSRS